jgi:hypothetical protein
MNDPHVVALTYRITHSEHVDFKKAPRCQAGTNAFCVVVDAGRVGVEMIEHFGTVQEARNVVEPFLRAWELAADLKHPEARFRFVYERPEVIDRDPHTGGAVIHVPTAYTIMAGLEVLAHASRERWPEPSSDLALSPDAEALHRRWLGCLDGKETLLGAAYWALSMIEAAPGPSQPEGPRMTKRRRNAGAFFNIDADVLSTLGHLTSARGGVEEGRKAEAREAPLTRSERKWLKAAFKALVERAARRAHYGAPPPVPLTMDDLPKLAP